MAIKYVWSVASVVFCLLLNGKANGSVKSDPTGQMVAQIQSTWHLQIVDHDLARTIVPFVKRPDRPVEMVDLSDANAPACLTAVFDAFSKYPASFISGLVSKVALADNVHVWSIRTGGFQIDGLLALNCQDAAQHVSFYEDTVHDELAGLLLERSSPDQAAWVGLNPAGFRYGDMASYQAELRNPQSRDGDDALHRNGFMSALGLTGMNNDIETYAAQLIGHPAETVQLLGRYPALRGKATLVMAIYERAAPALTKFFQASGLAEAAAH